ncbi:hypothetical protein Q8W71_29815 [Methylobacterium sp. NEAU 140]|uniref:hypothetical protein n=1 Tax=Methylobacterium sp. NEAU 140 TaxID=3064945 RepID=UPI002733F49D|nr:hypothetical protein [Methylobacterium sp. NEAU 140]MDP4026806.1 hypothetical protein [Methylobacterium sp. NEAU 140]
MQKYQREQNSFNQTAKLIQERNPGMGSEQAQALASNPAYVNAMLARLPGGDKDPSMIRQDALAGQLPQAGYRDAPGGQSFIPGGPADPAVLERNALAVATDKTQTPLTDIEARRKAGIPDHDTRTAWVDPYGKVTFNDGPPPLAARPGQTFYDRGTLKPILTAPSAKPDGFEVEGKLRGEFAKGLGTFGDVHDGYGRVIAATKQRQENPNTVSPASDINLIFGFMKMLDPGSVVREGEYATAKNAAGVPERVLNTYNKVLSGEFLTDRQRQDFIGQAGQLYGTARKTAEGVADRYRSLANSYGVDPGRSVYLPDTPVPPRLGEPQAQASQQTQTPAAIPQGAPDGTRLAADGKFYAPDPKRPGRFLEVR